MALLLLAVVDRGLRTYVPSSLGGPEMNVTRSFAVAATFAAVAVGAATPAFAAPEMRGHYIETETAANDRSATDDWYFTHLR